MKTIDDLLIAVFDSNHIQKHIQRAHYQQQLQVLAPFTDATSILNADAYHFVRKGSLLVPEIVI